MLVGGVICRVQVAVRMRVPVRRRVPGHEGEFVHVRLVRLVVCVLVRMVVGVDVRVIVRVDQLAVPVLVLMRMRVRMRVLMQVPGIIRLFFVLRHDGLLRARPSESPDSATRRRRCGTGYRLARRRASAGSGSGTAASSIRVYSSRGCSNTVMRLPCSTTRPRCSTATRSQR